jgi:hypothetical protein
MTKISHRNLVSAFRDSSGKMTPPQLVERLQIETGKSRSDCWGAIGIGGSLREFLVQEKSAGSCFLKIRS